MRTVEATGAICAICIGRHPLSCLARRGPPGEGGMLRKIQARAISQPCREALPTRKAPPRGDAPTDTSVLELVVMLDAN